MAIPVPGPERVEDPKPDAQAPLAPVPPKRSPLSGATVWRDLGISAAALVGAYVAVILVALLWRKDGSNGFGVAAFFGVALLFFFTAVRALLGLVWAPFARVRPTARDWAGLVVGVIAAPIGMIFALSMISIFTRGRQLRRRGKLLLPDVAPADGWTGLRSAPVAPPEARAALAAQWRENGRTEHASVAAFAQLTLELMALGAPPALLADVQRDATDEIRHAELCFSLARELDGRSESPGRFPAAVSTRRLPPLRSLALARVAVDSLLEGALLEGFSARLLSRLVSRCEDPAARALIRELAVDEARHAKHGWDAIRWCLAEGGAPVAGALRGAAALLPRQVTTTLPAAARDGGWERYGIPGAALERDAYLQSQERTRLHLERLLDGV